MATGSRHRPGERRSEVAIAVGAVIVALLVGLLAWAVAGDEEPRPASAPQSEDRADPDVAALYDRVAPSVVAVLVEGDRGEGEGSGVVWSANEVVTNNHVVSGADEIEVALASGDRRSARVTATDPLSDVALLRVEGPALPPVEFADDVPEIGSPAIAIGNPLGFENSVTSGVVSGVDRAIPSGGRTPALVGLVQTDAAISPGNSGGALVGASGEVIGINVAYIPPQAAAVSLGFAIPAPTVTHVVRELREDGTVDHAFFGAAFGPLEPRVAEQLGIDAENGAVLLRVTAGGPAADAGLRSGDVIVGVQGDPVRSVEDVFAAIREAEPGGRMPVEFLRDGERRQAVVTLAERPRG